MRLSLIALCALILSGCGAQSSVPFTAPSSLHLYALNLSAREGLLDAVSPTAWFSVRHGKEEVGGAVEIEVRSASEVPLRISLGLVTDADLTGRGDLVGNPASRPLSTVENAAPVTRIRMLIPPSAPGAAFAGLAVNAAPMDGTAEPAGVFSVQITSVSITAEETGWQNNPSFFWAGFSSEGGTLDAVGISSAAAAVLPRDSLLTLYFRAAGEGAGSIEKQGRTVFSAGRATFAFRKTPAPYTTTVPSLIFPKTPVTVAGMSGGDSLEGMRVSLRKKLPVVEPENPLSPIFADPHMIIEWPQEEWRRSGFEIFSWDRFPSILIFDTADYAVQDRFFKRLAFFVEKKGFKGMLSTDEEIAALHAFNAHDYRAESLAEFFEKARKEDFALNAEETGLRELLLAEGIIRKEGFTYAGGAGAVLSISRESVPYLRYMFIAHEGYHGIYFIDPDFRAKVAEIYHSLDKRALGFLESYFTVVDSLGYDTADSYLMENEFMAYLLQQPLAKVAPYFTGTISERFLRYGGDQALDDYIKATGASDFVQAAAALNEYAFSRWGIAGGRIGLFTSN